MLRGQSGKVCGEQAFVFFECCNDLFAKPVVVRQAEAHNRPNAENEIEVFCHCLRFACFEHVIEIGVIHGKEYGRGVPILLERPVAGEVFAAQVFIFVEEPVHIILHG